MCVRSCCWGWVELKLLYCQGCPLLSSERAVTRSGDKRVKSLSWNTDPWQAERDFASASAVGGAELLEVQPSSAVMWSAFSEAPVALQFTAENNLPTLFPPQLGGDHLPSVSAFSLKASLETAHLAPLLGGWGLGSLETLPVILLGSLLSPRTADCCVDQHRWFYRIILLLLSSPSSCCPRVSLRSYPPSFGYPSGHHHPVDPFSFRGQNRGGRWYKTAALCWALIVFVMGVPWAD